MNSKAYTLIKVRLKRTSKQHWALFLIGAGFIGVPVLLLGALKVHYCHVAHPGAPVLDCIRWQNYHDDPNFQEQKR